MKAGNMKKYFDCRTYKTGISAPHTIEIDGRRVSIEHGNAPSIILYYTQVCGLVKHGYAIDNCGNTYTIYASGPNVNAPGARVIAIPNGGIKA